MTELQVSFRARGRVQRVGFRFFVLDSAQSLGLAGWVRNDFDGSVSGEVGGEVQRVEAFRSLLLEGNGCARVDGLDWTPRMEGQSLPFPFEIRR
jgi:acylphosphatase